MGARESHVGSGQQVCFAGEVFVGAHRGVVLGRQKSVVHNWWTEECYFSVNRGIVVSFSTERSGLSRSTQNSVGCGRNREDRVYWSAWGVTWGQAQFVRACCDSCILDVLVLC